jgi:hypothetical protein
MDIDILRAALIGYEKQKADIEQRMSDLQRQLGNERSATATQDGAPVRNRNHQISLEGRARIAAAQRKRWAVAKNAGRATRSPTGAKRKLSPEARAKLAANLAKARAARAAKRAAA